MACDLGKIIKLSSLEWRMASQNIAWLFDKIHGTGIYFDIRNHVIWQAVPQQTTLDVQVVYQIPHCHTGLSPHVKRA